MDEVINEPQKLLVDIITEKDEGIHISEGIESYLEASEKEMSISRISQPLEFSNKNYFISQRNIKVYYQQAMKENIA